MPDDIRDSFDVYVDDPGEFLRETSQSGALRLMMAALLRSKSGVPVDARTLAAHAATRLVVRPSTVRTDADRRVVPEAP
jgi:hypothetical protein